MSLFTFAKKLKKKTNHILNRAFYLEPEILINQTFLGSDYGGWAIANELLNNKSVIYSVGLGQDITFDLALIQNFGLVVHGFDPTPKSIDWLKRQKLPKEFILHEYGLAAIDGNISFNPPKNENHVSLSIIHHKENQANAINLPVKSISTIMGQLQNNHIDLLKMDIEGSEYEVIESLLNTNIRPKQILIEFHHRFPEIGIKKSKQACKQLKQMGYQLFASSHRQEEFSFIYSGK